MQRIDVPVPGLCWGAYPERQPEPRDGWRRARALLRDGLDRLLDQAGLWRRRSDRAWVAAVRDAAVTLAALPPQKALLRVRSRLLKEGISTPSTIEALGLTCVVAQRQLGVTPFDTQLLAARAVLDNALAEMATGEGKTLAVALAACVGGLSRMPVHVITANDYLVARDAARLRPMARALGLSVGCIVQADESDARSQAYACDITFVTAKELVFDYLRDSLTARSNPNAAGYRPRRDAPPEPIARLYAEDAPPALLRGLCLAIVDEADAVLIDEARVPLILSQPANDPALIAHAEHALAFAQSLKQHLDYRLDAESMQAVLTDAGRLRLEQAADHLARASEAPAWRNRRHREHSIGMALAALYLFQKERHYLVRDGKIEIVDETTGRISEGRVWSQGLQQLIELKEGIEPTAMMATIAQLTYQRFFPRYLRLGGLSGTLMEARSELMRAYGLSIRSIPLRLPSRRQVLPTHLLADHPTLWSAVAERSIALHQQRLPVLLAADSVAEAQALCDALQGVGLAPSLLDARNDREEAAIVAGAGQAGAVTVTTNMAGRGTDILLGEGVAARGGLHVISCQLNASRRIDRQLAGRAARQGDPGSVETWLSLDTALLRQSLPPWLRRMLVGGIGRWPDPVIRWCIRGPQRAEERRQQVQRQRLIEQDARIERQMGFVGISE